MSRRTLSGALLLAIVASLVVLPGQAEASPPPPQVQYLTETGDATHNWY